MEGSSASTQSEAVVSRRRKTRPSIALTVGAPSRVRVRGRPLGADAQSLWRLLDGSRMRDQRRGHGVKSDSDSDREPTSDELVPACA